MGKAKHPMHEGYTLSHLENDRDRTLHNASPVRQSRDSFLNAWENTEVTRAITIVLFFTTRWRHGCSRVRQSIVGPIPCVYKLWFGPPWETDRQTDLAMCCIWYIFQPCRWHVLLKAFLRFTNFTSIIPPSYSEANTFHIKWYRQLQNRVSQKSKWNVRPKTVWPASFSETVMSPCAHAEFMLTKAYYAVCFCQ